MWGSVCFFIPDLRSRSNIWLGIFFFSLFVFSLRSRFSFFHLGLFFDLDKKCFLFWGGDLNLFKKSKKKKNNNKINPFWTFSKGKTKILPSIGWYEQSWGQNFQWSFFYYSIKAHKFWKKCSYYFYIPEREHHPVNGKKKLRHLFCWAHTHTPLSPGAPIFMHSKQFFFHLF